MKSPWPKPGDYPVDNDSIGDFALLQEIVTAIRTSRNEISFPPANKVKVAISGDEKLHQSIAKFQDLVKSLAKVEDMGRITSAPSAPASVFSIPNGDIYVLLEGYVDLNKEAVKKKTEIEKLEKYIQTTQVKLSNQEFVKKAPAGMVEAEKTKIKEAENKIYHIKRNLKSMGV